MSEFEFDLNIPKLPEYKAPRQSTWLVEFEKDDEPKDDEPKEVPTVTNEKIMKGLLGGELSGIDNPYDELYYLGD